MRPAHHRTHCEFLWPLQHLVKEYRAGVENGSIGADDIRSKFLRALEAKSMADNAMVVIPEHGRGYVSGYGSFQPKEEGLPTFSND